MCCFDGEGTVEKDLLENVDSFPIPIKEKFGGDVMIGWKRWKPAVRRSASSPFALTNSRFDSRPKGSQVILKSASFYTQWEPGKALEAVDAAQVDARRGIFAFDENVWEASNEGEYSVIGTVALWGKVRHFNCLLPASVTRITDRMSKEGLIGQFAYPLDLYVGKLTREAKSVAEGLAKTYGPSGVCVFFDGKQVKA